MKAILIDASEQSLHIIEVENEAAIAGVIGFKTLESEDVQPEHKLFFDEECFLRGSKGRFQLDKLIPISGKAVIVGNVGGELGDVTLSTDDLAPRIQYL